MLTHSILMGSHTTSYFLHLKLILLTKRVQLKMEAVVLQAGRASLLFLFLANQALTVCPLNVLLLVSLSVTLSLSFQE